MTKVLNSNLENGNRNFSGHSILVGCYFLFTPYCLDAISGHYIGRLPLSGYPILASCYFLVTLYLFASSILWSPYIGWSMEIVKVLTWPGL